jgi:hypothetical protein
VKPDVILGLSAVGGLFSKEVSYLTISACQLLLSTESKPVTLNLKP